MKIPTFTKQKFIDEEGNLMPSYQQLFDVVFQQMQLTLSDDGFVIPSQSTTNINHISNDSNDNSRPNGTIWYDNDTNEFKGKVNGIIKVFTVV
jgi:hypothetical protein